MKKFTSFWMMVALAMMSVTFASCDDDPWHDDWDRPGYWPGGGQDEVTTADEAAALCTEWYGTVRYTYQNEVGGYDVAEFYADMTFSRYSNNALRGVGTEKDYTYNEDGSINDTQTLTFTWRVLDNFDIQIDYDRESGGGTYTLDANASQKGFKLEYDKSQKKYFFYGYMIGSGSAKGNEIMFDFEEVNRHRSRASETTVSNGKSFGIFAERPALQVSQGRLIKNR